jgi:class 3 adenylate cyclase
LWSGREQAAGFWPAGSDYSASVDTFPRAEAAQRAGVTLEALNGLVELSILNPDADDRLSEGDIRRVGVVHRLETAGIPLDILAPALRDGTLTLDFVDDPAYGLFASFTGETFQELSKRTDIPLSLLLAVREATGSAVPAPEDHVREDEMAIIPLLQFQLAHGFRPVTMERTLRVIGDSLRRVAETGGDAWRSEVMEPLFAAGLTAGQIGAATAEVSEGMAEIDSQALLAIYRGQQAHVWMANIIGGFESMLARTGRHVHVDRLPAMCFLDITGYTRLTQERGDAAAADLSTELARLVERTSVKHGGRPIKWLGDGVMFFFKDPGPGVVAALEMVVGVAEAGLPPAHVGLHAGPVVFQEGDYYGQTVNVAARIADYARPGEVLVSQDVVDAASGVGVAFREIGPVELKGVGGAMRLHAAHRPA